MSVTKAEIRVWLEQGKQQGATHVLIIIDAFNFVGYPVYVSADQNVRDIESHYDGIGMQRIEEVYNLSLSLEDQLNEYRARNY